MNKFILFICILFTKVSYSQMVGGHYMGSDGVPGNLEFYDENGKPLPIGDDGSIEGSPLLQNNWTFGIIKLQNGRTLFDSSVNYSLYNDKLFFKKNGQIYPINYPVKEFSIEYSDNSNEKKIYKFQNGFPGVNKNDGLTFYQILYSGNSIKLLKRPQKKIRDIYTYGGPAEREYSLVQDFYIFFPAKNEMTDLGIKINLNVLKKNLPEYSNQIDAYTSAHALNTKSDDDLIQLFSFLDSAPLPK